MLRLDVSSFRTAARFLVKFNVFAIPLYLVMISGWQLPQLIEATAAAVQLLLGAAGVPFERSGLTFSVPVNNGNWGAVINWDCVGWKSMLAAFALVMATDFKLKRKLKGLAVLLPVVYAANLLRIAFLVWFVAAYDTAYFALVHAALWSWGLIAVVAVSWAAWVKQGNLNIRRLTN